jgi:hypothetical protein
MITLQPFPMKADTPAVLREIDTFAFVVSTCSRCPTHALYAYVIVNPGSIEIVDYRCASHRIPWVRNLDRPRDALSCL